MSFDDEDFETENDFDLEGTTYACEDCDHRWEPSDIDEMICPMCGSENVVEL